MVSTYKKLGLPDLTPGYAGRTTGDAEILRFAFGDPVIPGGSYHPLIRRLDDLEARNKEIFVERDWFSQAYVTMTIEDVVELVDEIGRSVLKVSFKLRGKEFESFAYGKMPTNCGSERSSFLVIPGSGFNQGVAIADQDKSNYHADLYPVLNMGDRDVFVFIKPNESFLSWTDGSGSKVTGDFIYNWHLNRGGSYSVSYLTQALAMQRYLGSCYGETVVAGLSQGGFAALLVALQSKPTAVIVASGYSVITEQTEWSGPQQIVGILNQADLYRPDVIRELLSQSSSRWLFTWGRQDIGTFRLDALEGITAKVLAPIDNVVVEVHDGGHEFRTDAILQLLQDIRFR